MTKRTVTTIRQKLAFEELLKAIETGEGFSWKEIMKRAKYSEATAINPSLNLLEKPGFKALLEKISDEPLLARLYEIALDSDKRASLSAIDMLMGLKDRKPSTKYKIDGMDSEYKSLFALKDEAE